MDIYKTPTILLIQCNQSKIPSFFTKNSNEHVYTTIIPRTLTLEKTHVVLIEPHVFFGEYDLSKELDIAMADTKVLLLEILTNRQKPVVVFTEDYLLDPMATELKRGCRNFPEFTLLHVREISPAEGSYYTVSVTTEADMFYTKSSDFFFASTTIKVLNPTLLWVVYFFKT